MTPPLRAAALFLLLPAARSFSDENLLDRCPPETQPMRTADPERPWACVLTDRPPAADAPCPEGFERVMTLAKDDPSRCALSEARLEVPRGLCPAGQRPAPTSDPAKQYECEKQEGLVPEGLSCPKGARPVPTPGTLSRFRCVRPAAPSAAAAKGGYRRYEAADIAFDYPRAWSLADSWKEDLPAILLLPPDSKAGRTVSLSVIRQRRASKIFEPMATMIEREKLSHEAREKAGGPVAGRAAIHLEVPSESAMAFLDDPEGYIILSYTAPPELFARHLPAYERLLQSVSLAGRAKVPEAK